MDYTAFQALVASYLHRTDLTAVIPTFIDHGRLRLGDVLRVPEMDASATVTMTGGVGPLPAETVYVRSVQGPTQPLLIADLDLVTTATVESVYAVVGADIWAPGCGTVDVFYTARPATLLGAAGTATRTVLDKYPQVWLYAALIEAYIYLDDAENEAKMTARFDEEVRRANARGNRMRFPRVIMSDSYANILAGGPGL